MQVEEIIARASREAWDCFAAAIEPITVESLPRAERYAANAIIAALDAVGYVIAPKDASGPDAEEVAAVRAFIERHPAFTLIDLAEFEAFVKFPSIYRAMLAARPDASER